MIWYPLLTDNLKENSEAQLAYLHVSEYHEIIKEEGKVKWRECHGIWIGYK